MKQHALDLMPTTIRARSLAGQRTSRMIAVSIFVAIITLMVATHSRLELSLERIELDSAKGQAKAVVAIEVEAVSVRRALDETRAFIELYDKVAYPLPVSAILATLINSLPDSVTLDQLDLDAGVRTVSVRSARSRGADTKTEPSQRVLRCEVSGFAATDEHIAQLVSTLEQTAPFRHVNLDFSRTKRVNEHDAREFRLSFKIDLAAAYALTLRDVDSHAIAGAPTEQEAPYAE
jgi:Tfp pilus assembly protein PilN